MGKSNYTREEVKELFDRIETFTDQGSWEFIFNGGEDALTRFANNYIHQSVARADTRLSLRVILDQKVGKAVTNNLSDESLKEAVQKAIDSAKSAHKNEEIMPPLQEQEYRKIENYNQDTTELSPAQRAEKVKHIVAECRKEDFSAAGIIDKGTNIIGIGNTEGLFAYHRGTNSSVSLTVEGDNGSGWSQEHHYDFNQIDFQKITDTAIKKCKMNQDPEKLEPGEYTVILEPDAVADLLLFAAFQGFGAKTYLENRSFLSGRLGEKLFSEELTINDNAYHEDSTGIPFDFEGVPKQKVKLVDNGRAINLVHNRKTAKKLNTESTGHALPPPNPRGPIPMNVNIEAGDTSFEEMVDNTENAILVTHFHYSNVVEPKKLIVTGMTRDGTFAVKDGELSHPVKNLRFTENLVKAFSNIEAISQKRKMVSAFWGGSFLVPALKINNFRFSSKTEF